MAETATMAHDQAHPKRRDDDARGTPSGQAALPQPHGGQIGNPPFEATAAMRQDVEAWVRAGANIEDLANLIESNYNVPCSPSTVERHFKRERAVGRARVKVAIGGKLVKQALEGDRTSQIFWLRTQGRWSVRVEHTGEGGGPIKTFDLSGFNGDEKRLLLGVVRQLLDQHGGDGTDGDRASPDQQPTIN